MFEDIKTFLSSPPSLDPIEPIKKISRRRSRRRTGVSKCVLSKSIYEETDLSKLTPRQRILNQKYQKLKTQVTSLFLISNNIPARSVEAQEDREPVDDVLEESVETSAIEDKSMSSRDIEPFLGDHGICGECFNDAVEIYSYLEMMGSVHRCRRYTELIAIHKASIRQNFRRRHCFSRIKTETLGFVCVLGRTPCCKDEGTTEIKGI